MSENFNSHIACEGTDNDINWVCKVCKDLPNYAGMYLYQREREKNQLKNVKDRRADLILLKYYYALLHLLDKIHELHECPNPENDVPKYADRKCSTPECFVYYRYIYNTYASILMTEKGLNQINLRCDICSVLPYTIFSDLEMIAKNMHSDDMEKTQKLEIEAVIADYYLEAVGSCEQWDECPSGVDWLELIKSVQLLRKYLEKKDRKELQISLNEWNRVRSIDNILNTEIKTTCRDFQTKNIPLCVLEKKTLVYMDFGVYQLYESITEIKLRSAQSLHIKLFILLMIVSFTEPLEVVFMMLIISVMRQNVTILLPVIMHCHRRRWKFIVILDAKPMSSIVKRKHRILPYLWQCYVRKQLLHKTFVILYRFVHCNHMWKVLLSYFKKFVLREK